MQEALPDGQPLDTRGAFAFLTEKAMLLEQAGFAVMLPAWWSGRGAKMRLSARGQVKSPKMAGGSGLNLDQIVQFDWQLALGDEELSLAELQELAQLKSPLVKMRGQWVQLNAEEIQAALKFWQKKSAAGLTAREALHLALGGVQTPGDITFAGLKAEGWVGDLLAELQGESNLAELPVPDNFHGTLRPYQVRGYSWLGFLKQWGLGACLADDMGLGKTVQTLALIPGSGRPTSRNRSCWSAPPPWWATGRRKRPASPRNCRCWSTMGSAGPREGVGQTGPEICHGDLQLRSAASGLSRCSRDSLGRGDPGRGAEHQESRDQTG